MDEIQDSIFDILVDHKNHFLTTDEIYNDLINDSNKKRYDTKSFYDGVMNACDNIHKDFNKIYKFSHYIGFTKYTVLIFTDMTNSESYNELRSYKFSEYEPSSHSNAKSDPLEYLDYIITNNKNYFNPNTSFGQYKSPLHYLASYSGSDCDKYKEVMHRLFEYNDLNMFTKDDDGYTCYGVASDHNNYEFMNRYYEKKIRFLKDRVKDLENQLVREKKKTTSNMTSNGFSLTMMFIILMIGLFIQFAVLFYINFLIE